SLQSQRRFPVSLCVSSHAAKLSSKCSIASALGRPAEATSQKLAAPVIPQPLTNNVRASASHFITNFLGLKSIFQTPFHLAGTFLRSACGHKAEGGKG